MLVVITTDNQSPELALASLGFTDIEAAIYCELLRGAPSTGYRLAKAIGKAPANTYQALASLASKGAVMTEEGKTKTYRVTPPAELLTNLQRAFDASRCEAQAALEALHAHTADDRVYQLKSPAQIYERVKSMIAGSREILLFDLFPEPFAQLEPALRQAQARGVVVSGLVYSAVPHLSFPVAMARSSAVVAERWPGLQLTLVVDACEHLVALLSADGATALRGVWSDSVYLACLQHSGLAAEIQLSAADPVAVAPFQGLSLLRAYPAGLTRLIGPPATLRH